MINLIPKEEKKRMVKNFRYKLTILFFVVLGASFLIVLVTILPAFFLSSIKSNIVNEKLKIQNNEPVSPPQERIFALIKDLNNKIKLVENAETNKFIISQKVINAIVFKKMPSIKITDILYESDLLKGKKVRIEGNAPSREVLLLFRQALEDGNAFKQVDLPIANFVKGSDIKFYLNLIPS